MTEINEEKSHFGRLEDFIEMAKTGKRIEMEVELRKQSMIQVADVGETHDTNVEISTYLWIADYTFKTDGQIYKLSKVYMFAAAHDSPNSLRLNNTIANARLQVDYNRLKAAHINFHEKFF